MIQSYSSSFIISYFTYLFVFFLFLIEIAFFLLSFLVIHSFVKTFVKKVLLDAKILFATTLLIYSSGSYIHIPLSRTHCQKHIA